MASRLDLGDNPQCPFCGGPLEQGFVTARIGRIRWVGKPPGVLRYIGGASLATNWSCRRCWRQPGARRAASASSDTTRRSMGSARSVALGRKGGVAESPSIVNAFWRLLVVLVMALVMLGNAHSWLGVAGAVALGALAVLLLANELTDFTPWGYVRERKRSKRRRVSRQRRSRPAPRGGGKDPKRS
jgi:hypothetical protein